jgi:hypothetical protein
MRLILAAAPVAASMPIVLNDHAAAGNSPDGSTA